MSDFRRELLVNNGPARFVVQEDPTTNYTAEIFYVEREGAAKQVPRADVQEIDWIMRTLLDLRDHMMTRAAA